MVFDTNSKLAAVFVYVFLSSISTLQIFTFALTFSMRDVYDSYSHKHKKQLGKIKV